MARSSEGMTATSGVDTTLFEALVPGGTGADGPPRGGFAIRVVSGTAIIKITPGRDTVGRTMTSTSPEWIYIPKLSGYGPVTKIVAQGSGGDASVAFNEIG